MHFSSLSLLGLHFANPQSVHQQISQWSPGTSIALTRNFQWTQHRSKNNHAKWKTILERINSTEDRLIELYLKRRTTRSQYEVFPCLTSLFPKISTSLDNKLLSEERCWNYFLPCYSDTASFTVWGKTRNICKIKDVNTFMLVRSSDENKRKAWESSIKLYLL